MRGLLSAVAAVSVLLIASSSGQRQQQQQCASVEFGINMCRYESHEDLLARLRDLERR